MQMRRTFLILLAAVTATAVAGTMAEIKSRLRREEMTRMFRFSRRTLLLLVLGGVLVSCNAVS